MTTEMRIAHLYEIEESKRLIRNVRSNCNDLGACILGDAWRYLDAQLWTGKSNLQSNNCHGFYER